MLESIQRFLSPDGLIPHGVCITWRPELFWSQVIADSVIALSYFTIPVALVYFVIKRRDIRFRGVAVLFGVFIISCGLTHASHIVTLWYPFYGIDSIIKTITALVSLAAAIAVWLIMPDALLIPTHASMSAKSKLLDSLEKRYQTYFEQSHDGMGMVDPVSTRILDANDAWCKMLGYRRDELLQITITEIEGNVPQDTEKRVHAIRTQGFAEFEAPMVCKDGRVLTTFVTVKQVEIDGQIRLLGTIRDITKQKEAEKQLRASQQLLQSIVEHIPIMVFVKRASDLRFVLFNRAGEHLLGYSRHDLIGKGNYDLWPKKQGDWFTAADRAVLSTREVTEIAEEPIKTASGEERYLHTWKVAVGEEEPEYLLGISVDITEKKRSEAALRESEAFLKAIYDNIHAAIFVINVSPSGEFKYGGWNHIGESFTGIPSAQAIGKSPEEVFGPVIGETLHDHYTRCLHEGTQVYEEQLYPKDACWFLTTLAALRDEHGQVYKIIGFAADISDQKHTELQLIEARKQAESASVAKSRFLATISHEIRTPMNGILGMAQILAASEVGEYERRSYAKTILTSGKTLLTLLNDILDLSKVEAGKIRLDLVSTKPSTALHSVNTLFTEAAHLKSLHITERWVGPDFAYLLDPYRLHQMLSNLVGNAIKFTARGSIALEASEIARDEEMAVLRFSVTDTGIGIAEEMRHLIFEPFSQVDGSITRQYGGTGLGLSIVSRLAKIMEGEVGFESEVGKGSRFWFTLRAAVIADPADNTEFVDTKGDTSLLSGTVLVVEDDKTNCVIIETFLQKLGMHVLFAYNGQQALNMIENEEHMDMIFMDLHMPVMDGYTATEWIRRWEAKHQTKRHPIVALTSDAFEQTRQRCLSVGMDDFITKPFSIDNIRDSIHQWVKKKPLAAAMKGIDETDLLPRIRALIPLLEEKDFDAIERANALQEVLTGTEMAATFSKVMQLIRQCNFDAALQHLRTIMTAKGWEA